MRFENTVFNRIMPFVHWVLNHTSALHVLLFIVLFSSCVRVYDPVIDQTESCLVVEASLIAGDTVQVAKLSYSIPYSALRDYTKCTGASVYITNNQGNTIYFEETMDAGIYHADTRSNVAISIGYTYTLHILTTDGLIYESVPQTLVVSPEMDRLYCESDKETVIEEDVIGSTIEVEKEGISVFLDTKGILPNNNYYLLRIDGFNYYSLEIISSSSPTWYLSKYENLATFYSNVFSTADADLQSGKELIHQKITFLSTELLAGKSYYPNSYETDSMGITSVNTTYIGYYCRASILSLSPDAYSFYRSAQDQMEASGKIFDPIAAQLVSNIQCVSEPSKAVFGVFNVSARSTGFAYFKKSGYKDFSSTELDSFPVLDLDSASFDWSRLNPIPDSLILSL